MSTTTRAPAGRGTFARGIHPPEEKHLAKEVPIEVLPTPKEVRIPLVQHLGAPCELAIEAKQEVAIGTVVGEAKAFVSAPVHATVEGKTARPSVTTLPNGRHVTVVPITAAAEQSLTGQALYDDLFGGPWPKEGLEAYSPEEISQAVLAAGIVGLGGAAFPTHVKLARNEQRPVDTLLVNGCECEPYLTSDYRFMLEAPDAIVCGALLAAHACGAGRVVIGIEDNKPEAITALRRAVAGTPIELQVLKTKYPQGAERQLSVAMVEREVPTGGLPLDVGVVVQNVGTVAAIARAVVRGKPLTHRVITVTGRGILRPANLLVPIGTPYQDLIDHCGGLTDDAVRVVAGGPMMGFTLGDLATPVTKGTSGVTVLTAEEVRRAEETTCVRCGRCVDACPLHLVPTRLALAARVRNTEVAARYFVTACVECGCCAYVCPAGLPLVQLIRLGKIQATQARNN
jgi:electron transport complex protein RnfC